MKKLKRNKKDKKKLTSVEKRHIYDVLKMVIFMSIGWFIYDDKDFFNEKRKIKLLNDIGRDEFYKKIFT